MLQTLNNIYKSPDLLGDDLLLISKNAYEYFHTNIQDYRGLKKTAWVVASVVYGLFAILTAPVLVPLAMASKAIGVILHNRSQIRKLQMALNRPLLVDSYSESIQQQNITWPKPPLTVYWRSQIDSSDYLPGYQEAIKKIQSCCWKLKQVYLELEVSFNNNSFKQIHISLHSFA